eukprot:9483361-Pyramimonas_sp.AAC.1
MLFFRADRRRKQEHWLRGSGRPGGSATQHPCTGVLLESLGGAAENDAEILLDRKVHYRLELCGLNICLFQVDLEAPRPRDRRGQGCRVSSSCGCDLFPQVDMMKNGFIRHGLGL